MTDIKQLREMFPMYDHLADADVLMGVHRKFYPNTHVKEFVSSIKDADIAMAKGGTDETRDYWRENVQKPLSGESSEDTQSRLVGSASGPVGNPGGAGMAAMRGATQGLTFGFGDEIGASVVSKLTGETYDEALKRERDLLALSRKENPKLTTATEIGSALAAPAAVLKSGGGLLANMLKAGTVGAGEAFSYGFGTGEGGARDRVQSGLDAAKWGAGFGLASPYLGKQAKRIYDKAKSSKAIKTAARSGLSMGDLRAKADDIFNRADQSQGLNRAALTNAAQSMADMATKKGMDEVLTPQSHRAVNRILDEATTPNPQIGFRDLDILRRQAGIPAGNVGNRVEASIGTNLVHSIDDVLDAASPGLGAEVAEARAIWGRLRRSEIIQEAFRKAENQASGFENGIRIQLRSILNNPKKLKGFSGEEVDLMKDIVQGTGLSNTLKKIGKFGVGQGQQSNSLMTLLGFGMAGPAAPIAGTMAQKGAEIATNRNAGLLQGLVSSGGTHNVPKLSDEARGLIEMIIRGGGRATAAAD